MSYRCMSPEAYDGRPVGTRQCVEFVKISAGAPYTGAWRKGALVKGNMNIPKGTAIATFDSHGRYPNHAHGNHAAIYVGQDAYGIWVYDQWVTKGHVSKRHIDFRGQSGMQSNDGDDYYVIE